MILTPGLDQSNTSKDYINLYPNPSSTTITLSTPTTLDKNAIMTIYNINGQQLFKRQITEQQTEVNVSGLPQGIYSMVVTDDKRVRVGKFVKQ